MPKKISESPTVTDEILFEINTTDADDCLSTPYKISKVVILYAKVEFTSSNFTESTQEIIPQSLSAALAEAKQDYCDDPSEANQLAISKIEAEIDKVKKTDTFYYKTAKPIATFGFEDPTGATESFPAWLNPDLVPASEKEETEVNNILEQALDENEDPKPGEFTLTWNPVGMREGNYFICWTWTPNIAGSSMTAHIPFSLLGNTQITTAIPTHATVPEKYETLLDRYMAEHTKTFLSNNDLSPYVIQELNRSVAKGFTFMEDLANQTIDLLDANATHEALLSLLSNLFNLKLRSNDPTLWRRQIKQAVPLFKKKGTLCGLTEALSQAGMALDNFTRLWQVVSPYTFQEHFDVEIGQTTFTLTKKAVLPVDLDNIEVYWRGVDDDEWTEVTSDHVELTNSGNITTMTWVGADLSIGAIELEAGDSVRILYEVVNIPNSTEQDIEDFIRTLPLMDQRDERDQNYPLKNWNVRLMEEDDPMFDVIISVKHPFAHDVEWGWIRTEFPFSENAYNMDEYNGSKRQSTDPCDIDRDFLEECGACLSSKFNVDVEIEELSNDRVIEAQQIIDEFTPFHAVLHAINFSGGIIELMQSPHEEIEMLVRYEGEEILASGEAQLIFNRSIPQVDALAIAKRTMLSNMTEVFSGEADIKNDAIVIYSPGSSTSTGYFDYTGDVVRFSEIPIKNQDVGGAPLTNSNLLEILAPHPLAGEYSIDNPDTYSAEIVAATTPVSESPLDKSQFTFRFSNRIINQTSINIEQANVFTFNDVNIDFAELGVKSQWDVDNAPDYTGGAWSLDIDGLSTYTIDDVLPGGILLLRNDGSLPATPAPSYDWTLNDDTATEVTTGDDGVLTVEERGRVDFNPSGASSIDDVRNIIHLGDYVLYDGTQYKICSFEKDKTHQFHIADYTLGDVVGVEVTVYRRVADNMVGQFDYKGVTLTDLGVDLISTLPVQERVDGSTEADEFKENYLIYLTDQMEYYSIIDIEFIGADTVVQLNGPIRDWSSTGTAGVSYKIYHFEKLPITIPAREQPTVPGHSFDYDDDPPLGLGGHVDRTGSEVITVDIETTPTMAFQMKALNAASQKDQTFDILQMKEAISYKIEYLDGTVDEGEI